MIIFKHLLNKKNQPTEPKQGVNFFDLPADKQRKIIKKAAVASNESQSSLMKRYQQQLAQ